MLQSKLKWWIASFRPKTLPLALVPILVGTLLSPIPFSRIDWSLPFFALLAVLSNQIGMNLLNDAIDVKKGTDAKDRLGPLRGIHVGVLSRQEVLYGAIFFFICTFLLGIPLMIHSGWIIFLVIVFSIGSAIFYSVGRYSLSYSGTGEPICILFYGVIGTCVPYFLQMGMIAKEPLLAGLQIGLFATVHLTINNLRDAGQDRLSFKNTVAVKYGIFFTKSLISFFLLFPYFLNLFWFFLEKPLMAFLPFLTLPLALKVTLNIWHNEPGKIYNQYLPKVALLDFVFGTLLILAFTLT